MLKHLFTSKLFCLGQVCTLQMETPTDVLIRIKYNKAFICLITALLIMWSFVVIYGNHKKL
jgi:hypothetical protein